MAVWSKQSTFLHFHSSMALKKQLKKALKSGGPQTIASLIATLSSTEEAIRGVISKNEQKFSISGDMVELKGDVTPTTSPNASPKPEKRKAEDLSAPEETAVDAESQNVSTPCKHSLVVGSGDNFIKVSGGVDGGASFYLSDDGADGNCL